MLHKELLTVIKVLFRKHTDAFLFRRKKKILTLTLGQRKSTDSYAASYSLFSSNSSLSLFVSLFHTLYKSRLEKKERKKDSVQSCLLSNLNSVYTQSSQGQRLREITQAQRGSSRETRIVSKYTSLYISVQEA